MSERSGIEIDYCPTCRGVWLDRGELDKIVERSFGAADQGQPAANQYPNPAVQQAPPQNQFQGRSGHHSGGYDEYGRKRKKESWFSELFD